MSGIKLLWSENPSRPATASLVSLARPLPPLHFLQTDVVGRRGRQFVKDGGEEAVWLARLLHLGQMTFLSQFEFTMHTAVSHWKLGLKWKLGSDYCVIESFFTAYLLCIFFSSFRCKLQFSSSFAADKNGWNGETYHSALYSLVIFYRTIFSCYL